MLYKSNQVTGYLIGNRGYFEVVKQFFISSTCISNTKMKFAKNQAKAKQHPGAEI